MTVSIHKLLLIPLLFCLSVATAESAGLSFAKNNDELILPEGFQAVVVADRLAVRPARHIAVRDNGDIYVKTGSSKKGMGIAALRDTDADGRADRIEYFADYAGSGIGIHDGYLYASSDSRVFRYRFKDDNSLLPDTSGGVVVEGFPVQVEHAAKGLAFDGKGNVYVSVGAPSNACMIRHRTAGSPGQDPCPQLKRHAGVWRFHADRLHQTQQKDGMRYATGIRNPMAMFWNTDINSLFVAQHGRDQLAMFWPGLYNDEQNAELPAEELFQVSQGDDFGWPYCYYDQLLERKVLAPEYGGDGKKQGRCKTKKDPVIAFPGHMAPNALLFYTGTQFPERYRHGAFIAFHGSWNRAPLEQKGYLVAFVPFKNGKVAGSWEIFADNFDRADFVQSPGDARYRPTGLAQGPDGSLYVSDTVAGRIWRIVYTGEKGI